MSKLLKEIHLTTEIKELNFSHSEFDKLSNQDSLIVYKGELVDGRPVEIEIVYPKDRKTHCYIRVDNKDLLYTLNSEMKSFCKTKSMKEFIEYKLVEHYEDKKKKKKKKKK